MSTAEQRPPQSGNKRLQNMVIAGVLLGGVAAIYSTAMSKMKQKDDLSDIIDKEEAKKGKSDDKK